MQLTTRASNPAAPSSLDQKNRSVEVICATEAPVDVFDVERWAIIPEVLLMDGVALPANRQVPLFDTHDRSNGTGSVLGSARDLRVEGDRLIGRVYFTTEAEGEKALRKLSEGHLTDFSVGYRVSEATWIPENETGVVAGKTYTGPVRVVGVWSLKELSICPIAADPAAKARADANIQTTDPAAPEPKEEIKPMSEQERSEILSAERERVAEIRGMCRKYDIEPETADRWVSDGTALVDALAVVRRRLAAQPQIVVPRGHAYTYGEDGGEKRRAAAVDGLVLRAGVSLENPAPGAGEYRGIGLPDLARECLLAAGVRVGGMSKAAVIREALALTGRAMQTADFPLLLSGIANKVLRTSFMQAPSTWRSWCKIGSAADFKDQNRLVISAASALDEIPEHVPYKYGEKFEAGEILRVLTYGKLFAVTRQALINDDLGALTDTPRAFAAAAQRKINELAYSILTANAAMSDGVALFHADHDNFIAHGAGAAPSNLTLSAGRLAMRSQTGLQGEILNVVPRYLIVPAGLETASDILLNSLSSTDDDKNSGVLNPWKGKISLVVDPLLDADDPVAWYLAADPALFDTVEMCFLDGKETPYLETRDGWTVDGVEYKVRIDAGAKALDHRGLFFNDGN